MHVVFLGIPRLARCPPGTAGLLVAHGNTEPRQLALVDDVFAVAVLSSQVATSRSAGSARLFPTTYEELLTLTHDADQTLGYCAEEFTSHFYRLGGSLHILMQGASVEAIAMCGRWASPKSLHR